MGIITLWLVLFARTSVHSSRGRFRRVGMASRQRHVCRMVTVSRVRSSGVAIFIEIWFTSPFLVGVRVKVLNSCGMSYRSIGFPVWMLRKMFAARVRIVSYSDCRLGSLGITASSAVVSFPITP